MIHTCKICDHQWHSSLRYDKYCARCNGKLIAKDRIIRAYPIPIGAWPGKLYKL